MRRRREPLQFGLTAQSAKRLLASHGVETRENLRVRDLAERFAPPDGVWCSVNDWFGTVVAGPRAGVSAVAPRP